MWPCCFPALLLILPEVIQIPTGLDPHTINGIYKRLSSLQRPDNLQFCEPCSSRFFIRRGRPYRETTVIPLLLSDCQRKMALWGSQGQLNPCSAIYDVGKFIQAL